MFGDLPGPTRWPPYRSEKQVLLYVLIDPLVVEPTHLKNMRTSNWIISPGNPGEKFQKYVSCHQSRYGSNKQHLKLVLGNPCPGVVESHPGVAVFRSPRHWSILRELASLGGFGCLKMVRQPGHVVVKTMKSLYQFIYALYLQGGAPTN